MNVEGEIKHLIAAIQRLGSKSKGVLVIIFLHCYKWCILSIKNEFTSYCAICAYYIVPLTL